jgi:hypothetical protein
VQQQEGLVEDITSQPDSDIERRQMEVGSSSQQTRRKGKQPMAWSPRRYPDATIMLPVHSRRSENHANTARLRGETEVLGPRCGRRGKIPEFVQQVYLDSIGIGPLGDPILQPKPWAAGLENTGILNLLEIPHFGRGKEVNNCIKQLIAVLHGGFLWMEHPISIDVELITSDHRTSING